MIQKKNYLRVFALLLLILILAFGLRSIFFIKNLHNLSLSGDARNYHLMSMQLVDKGIFGYWYEGIEHGGKSGVSNARVTPGYPLFLAAVYKAFHDPYLSITVTRLLQVIIGALTPLLAFLFIRRLFKRNGAALITAFLVAVYPTYVLSPVYLLTEVLSLATMLLYFYLTVAGLQERKLSLNLLAGIAFAVHVLIRPAMLPLFIMPYIFAYITFKGSERKQVLKFFLQSAAGFIVFMLPWWIRNYVVLGSVVLTADGSGNPLLAGTYPYMKDFMKDVPENIKGISKLQADYAKERLIKGFSSEPLLYMKWFTIGKTGYMFSKPWLFYAVPGLQLAHIAIHYFLVVFGALAVVINSVINKINRFINFYGILFLGLYLIFVPDPRYAYQHMFFLMLAAAYLISFLSDKLVQSLKRA